MGFWRWAWSELRAWVWLWFFVLTWAPLPADWWVTQANPSWHFWALFLFGCVVFMYRWFYLVGTKNKEFEEFAERSLRTPYEPATEPEMYTQGEHLSDEDWADLWGESNDVFATKRAVCTCEELESCGPCPVHPR